METNEANLSLIIPESKHSITLPPGIVTLILAMFHKLGIEGEFEGNMFASKKGSPYDRYTVQVSAYYPDRNSVRVDAQMGGNTTGRRFHIHPVGSTVITPKEIYERFSMAAGNAGAARLANGLVFHAESPKVEKVLEIVQTALIEARYPSKGVLHIQGNIPMVPPNGAEEIVLCRRTSEAAENCPMLHLLVHPERGPKLYHCTLKLSEPDAVAQKLLGLNYVNEVSESGFNNIWSHVSQLRQPEEQESKFKWNDKVLFGDIVAEHAFVVDLLVHGATIVTKKEFGTLISSRLSVLLEGMEVGLQPRQRKQLASRMLSDYYTSYDNEKYVLRGKTIRKITEECMDRDSLEMQSEQLEDIECALAVVRMWDGIVDLRLKELHSTLNGVDSATLSASRVESLREEKIRLEARIKEINSVLAEAETAREESRELEVEHELLSRVYAEVDPAELIERLCGCLPAESE